MFDGESVVPEGECEPAAADEDDELKRKKLRLTVSALVGDEGDLDVERSVD